MSDCRPLNSQSCVTYLYYQALPRRCKLSAWCCMHMYYTCTYPARSTRCSLAFLMVSEPASRDEMWMVNMQCERVEAMFMGVCKKVKWSHISHASLSLSLSPLLPSPSFSLFLLLLPFLSITHTHAVTHENTHIHTCLEEIPQQSFYLCLQEIANSKLDETQQSRW